MAIHADYPGLTVEILLDGRPLKEYQHEEEEDAPKIATRYVECRSGAEFKIRTGFAPPFAPIDMGLRVCLDGVRVNSTIAEKETILDEPYIQSRTEWKEGRKWRASNFLFSDISVGM